MADGPRLRVVPVGEEAGVRYLQHTSEGTEPARPGEIRWAFRWRPPADAAGPVIFHVAANAANDDASEFGDRIYADSFVVRPPSR